MHPATGLSTPDDPPTVALLATDPAREHLGGISLSTLKTLVRTGLLRSVKIGRRRFYRRADLDSYVAGL